VCNHPELFERKIEKTPLIFSKTLETNLHFIYNKKPNMKFLVLNDHDHPFRLTIPTPILRIFDSIFRRESSLMNFNLNREMGFVLGFSKVEIDFFLLNNQKSFYNYIISLHYLFNRNQQSSSILRIFDYNKYDQKIGFHDFINQDSIGYTKIPSYPMNFSYHIPNKSTRIQITEKNLNKTSNFPIPNKNSLKIANFSKKDTSDIKSPLSKAFNIHNYEDLSIKDAILSIYISHVKSLRHNPFPQKWHQNTTKLKKLPWIKSKYEIEFPTIHSLIAESSKLRTLNNLLKRLKKAKHRVLIFCQMTKMMNIIEDYLQFKKYKYYRLDGGSGINDRRDMVDGFQNRTDIFVFLLSTRAGGLGVTLTAADDVIFYDNDWNPTMDAQAEDRAHRIGISLFFVLILRST
jgi:SNF2 family DNA or RNA helicase